MNKLIKGSLSAISKAKNKTLAESFLSCDVLILADMSSSMNAKDARGGKSRYDVAEQDIVHLQEKHQGKIALVVFANDVQFCPTGYPMRLGGGTELSKALRFIKPADDCGIKIVIVSDGEPFHPGKALKIAKTFATKIDVIYVGPEDDIYGGRRFLEKLAQATGGQFMQSESSGLLADKVERLLLTA